MAGEGLGSTAAKAAVATAVAAVVGGIISWIAGWLPAITTSIGAAAAWVWGVLVFSVPVPLAVLVILVLPLLIGLSRWIKRTRQEQPISAVQSTAQQLKPLERQVLQMLAQMDGLQLSFDMLVTHLQVRNLVLEQAVESLEQQGLVQAIRHRTINGPQLLLTRAGRDLVIELGFVPATHATPGS